MTGLATDLRFGLRTLRRSPAFTLVAVLTLAVGIGATTSIFSVLNAVVLRPLPFPESDRLIQVWEVTPEGDDFTTSEPNYLDFRDQTRTLEHLAAGTDRAVTLLGEGEPERLDALAVTGDFFAALRMEAGLGRTILPEEAAAGAPVAVLGDGLWRSRFGADPEVVGRTIRLKEGAYTVVGVMPQGFDELGGASLWLPLVPSPHAERDNHDLFMIGRLAEGATPASAANELRAVADRLSGRYPESNGGWSVRVRPLHEAVVGGDLTRTLWILMASVGLLLLLMCANIANLLLARGASRHREIGLRVALGAGRGRIVRQLLTESLLLSLAGMAGALLLVVWGVPLLQAALPPETPRLERVGVDGAVLAFALAASLIVALAFGLFPALHAASADVRSMLREDGRATSGRGRRIRDALVVGEMALAMTLLVGAGLLALSFLRVQQVDTGFAEDEILAIPVTLPGRPFEEHGEMARFLAELEERIGGLPGVAAVGATNVEPLSGNGTVVNLSVEGRPAGPGETTFARWRSVTPGFFQAAGVPLRHGRPLARSDFAPDAPAVVVVTEAFARTLFPAENPIGRRVAMGVGGTNWRTVVGVVEDVRDIRLAESPQPVFFLPDMGGWPWVTLLVRGEASPVELAAAVRREIRAMDPTLAIPTIEPLSASRRRSVAGPRFNLLLMGAFATVALILAVVGIYGIMSHSITRRTREIGIRVALGARPERVLAMVLSRGARLIAVGVGLGALAALGFGRVLGSILFDTHPVEVTAFAGPALVLGAVALASAWIPARRAARADPLDALRHE